MNEKIESSYWCSNTQIAFIVSIKFPNINCLLIANLLDVTSGSDGIELLPQVCHPLYLSNSVVSAHIKGLSYNLYYRKQK